MTLLSLTPLAVAIRYASLAAVTTTSLTVSADTTTITTEKAQYYTIPASALSVALNRFAQKANVSIIMDEAKLKNLNSQTLQGSYTINQGLAELLKGSGFQAKKEFSGYIIKKASSNVQNVAGTLALTTITSKSRFGDAPTEEGGFKTEYQTTATKMAMPLKETPQAISVITSDSLDIRLAQDLATAVELSAGVSTGTSASPSPGMFGGTSWISSGFTIRGRIADIRTDGFENTGYSSDDDGVDMAAFERVEVVKGPAGFYGQGSLGGYINKVRKKPSDEFDANISVQAGSYDTYRAEAG
jgi:outer membrane receptor for ferric coprogen and ferric-rhodotorulic acid